MRSVIRTGRGLTAAAMALSSVVVSTVTLATGSANVSAACFVQSHYESWAAEGSDPYDSCGLFSIQAKFVQPGNIYSWSSWKCTTVSNPDYVLMNAPAGKSIVGMLTRAYC